MYLKINVQIYKREIEGGVGVVGWVETPNPLKNINLLNLNNKITGNRL